MTWQWLKNYGKVGMGTEQERSYSIEIVGLFLTRNQIKTHFKNNVPGEDWFLGFKERHKLSIKKPQALEYGRKKASMDPFVIEKYFDILQDTLDNLDLHDKPDQIYNLDETGFNLDPSRTKVVGERNSPSVRVTSGPGKESTTVLMGGSASGEKLPPLIIVFKGKNVPGWLLLKNHSLIQAILLPSMNGWNLTYSTTISGKLSYGSVLKKGHFCYCMTVIPLMLMKGQFNMA